MLLVVLGEAALIGFIGGLLGVALGLGIARGVDWGSSAATTCRAFPYKPDELAPLPVVDRRTGGLLWPARPLFAVLGGYLPARRASTMEPAQALTQN